MGISGRVAHAYIHARTHANSNYKWLSALGRWVESSNRIESAA